MPQTRSTLNLKSKSLNSLLLPETKKVPRTSVKLYNFNQIPVLDNELFPVFGRSSNLDGTIVPTLRPEIIEGCLYFCIHSICYQTKTLGKSYFHFAVPNRMILHWSETVLVPNNADTSSDFSDSSNSDESFDLASTDESGYSSAGSNITLPRPSSN